MVCELLISTAMLSLKTAIDANAQHTPPPQSTALVRLEDGASPQRLLWASPSAEASNCCADLEWCVAAHAGSASETEPTMELPAYKFRQCCNANTL